MESKIVEIATLIEFLTSNATNKDKALSIKLAIIDKLITADEGLELCVIYTK